MYRFNIPFFNEYWGYLGPGIYSGVIFIGLIYLTFNNPFESSEIIDPVIGHNILIVVMLPVVFLVIALHSKGHINFNRDIDFEKLYHIGTFLSPILTFGTLSFLFLGILSESKKYRDSRELKSNEDKFSNWKQSLYIVIEAYVKSIDKVEQQRIISDVDYKTYNDLKGFVLNEFLVSQGVRESLERDYIVSIDIIQLLEDAKRISDMFKLCPEKDHEMYKYVKDYYFVQLRSDFGSLLAYLVTYSKDERILAISEDLKKFYSDFVERIKEEVLVHIKKKIAIPNLKKDLEDKTVREGGIKSL